MDDDLKRVLIYFIKLQEEKIKYKEGEHPDDMPYDSFKSKIREAEKKGYLLYGPTSKYEDKIYSYTFTVTVRGMEALKND